MTGWIERLIGYGEAFGFNERPEGRDEFYPNAVVLVCAGCGAELACFGPQLPAATDAPPAAAILEDVRRQLEAHQC